ncbi:M56 family metallopeptidase [Candidatus Clostridium radicumherbarum]|uniref:M56 family metallopeptidase n=1 Tax=Candidatus Clostridium radicumherbarum TaxID=3381662 RepID=A0ABW8TQ38_9CLOT
MNLAKLFYYIFSLSIMGSILTIGLIIVKGLFKDKLSANFHYYIWFLLIIRLIIPYLPSADFNIINFIPTYNHNTVIELQQPSTSGTTEKTSPFYSATNKDNLTTKSSTPALSSKDNSWQVSTLKNLITFKTLSLIWLVGVIVTFSYILLVNGILLFRSKKLEVCQSKDILQILEECKSILKFNPRVSLVYDDAIKSPAIFGLFPPKISISKKIISKLAPEELRYILLHELSHLKREDLFVNALVLSLQSIYWFNPLIWYALHQMKQDCEIACDANVITTLKTEDHKNYGMTIIKLLQLLSEPNWTPGTLGFISRFNKRRIVMISSYKKATIKWTAAAIALTLLAGCSSLNNPVKSTISAPNQNEASNNGQTNNNSNSGSNATSQGSATISNAASQGIGTVSYSDKIYGFSFSLPAEWKGFSIVNSMWEGSSLTGDTSKITQTGPMISLRNPKWTSKAPMQDIPIMIFTINQWNSLQKDEFHIGAAPVNPSELGRNNKYVFALPARYNFAFLPGYEEVETILKGKPLKTTNIDNEVPDSITLILSNIMLLGKQGKVINSDFLVKINNIEDVEKEWGKADKTDWVAAAKGSYATYKSYNIVFGLNKGNQIFEIRTYDNILRSITLSKTKAVLGTPAYDAKSNSEEIIGYVASPDFKIEMVFPAPSKNNPDPVMDHYNVLYPAGTVNSMSNDPGRQW